MLFRSVSADAPGHPLAEIGGARSIIAVPMLKEGQLIGAFAIYRQEVRPFTDKQIDLVTTFAAQAVIAIENTRLLNELRQRTDDLSEALEQQTATSEVLKVISSSPGELGPVFQAMLENATRICNAKFGVLFLHENGMVQVGAQVGSPAALAEYLRKRGPLPVNLGTPVGRVIQTKQPLHITDVSTDQELSSPAVKLGGARTYVAVPMLKDNEAIDRKSVV